ncbi:PEP-CTERM sorting domain-containing protein [Chamaesiphon sp. VAR_48_metabat_135_sub]|uniref:PEP-CTERM sorting domain-containing protein n=1 Tax=Chamaesiphon sp. VAR_48_metabat_135_sub TaxID=2964699 RepID=UPI00286C8BE1|nr:PEP-CTERM sorting domain-containing protein [Chamaesiphon sp. VAR_48_metabat_135_sub]
MKLRSWGLIAGVAMSGVVAGGSFDRVGAVTTVLYDGSSGVTPDNSPYLDFRAIGVASQIASGGVTTLNTFDPNPLLSEFTFAGYGNRSNAGTLLTSTLDNSAGYTLSFKIKINSQTNTGANGPNRAGFSVLVLGSDKKGVEIGFRDSDIFAQNSSFNAINATEQKSNIRTGILDTLTTYDLKVTGSGYTLTIGSNPNQSFSGLLKDYSAAAITPLTQVYNTADVIFFGDNTTSAGASVDIQNITLNTNAAAVPEPSSLLGMGLAIGFGATLKRKLGKTDRSITKLLK